MNITRYPLLPTLPVSRESKIGVPGWFSKNPNTLIPLLFLRSSTGCQWPNVFNSTPLFIPSSLWTTSHLSTSPASSMCASQLLTPSDPPLSLVFTFWRHALLLAIEQFHPLLLVYEQPPCHDQRHYHHCLFQKVS